VYKLTPPASSGGAWTETTVHNFLGGTTDGSGPTGSVLIGKSGVLYGVTISGGTGNGGFGGVVYQIVPPAPGAGWKESVIYDFTLTTDGGNPYAGVITDSSGNLYGTTYQFGWTVSTVDCRLRHSLQIKPSFCVRRFLDGKDFALVFRHRNRRCISVGSTDPGEWNALRHSFGGRHDETEWKRSCVSVQHKLIEPRQRSPPLDVATAESAV